MSANTPESSPTPRRTDNRRVTLRRTARGGSKVTCRRGAYGLGPNLAVSLLDVSETGARLLLKETLAVKQEVEVCLLAPGHVRERKQVGRIVWVVPAADGKFCVGIEFDKRLEYSAVQDLGLLPRS